MIGREVTGDIPGRRSEARRTASLPASAEVVIIGGGIIGAATAFALRRAGVRSVIIELGDTLANLTTANASANVRVAYASAAEFHLVDGGLSFYEQFAERTGLPEASADIGFVRHGGLFATLDSDGPGRLRAIAEQQRLYGASHIEVVPGDDLRDRFPWLAPAVTAGIVRPRDAWVSGIAATLGLVTASEATVCLDTAVTGFALDAGRLSGVQTSRGTIATRQAVIATGPFASRVAGIDLPVTLVRRHRLTISHHPAIPSDAPLTLDLDRGSYWRPALAGALIGWPRETNGGPALAPVPPDPSFPEVVLRDQDGVQRISPFWRTIATERPRSTGELVAGQYDHTPDGAPLIDELANRPGLWVNAGYSGQGVLAAPEGGRILAELMSGTRDRSANPFRIDRFPAPERPAPDRTVMNRSTRS